MKFIQRLALFEKEPVERVRVTKEQLERDGFGDNPWFRCLLVEVASGEEEKRAVGFALFCRTYATWDGPCFRLEDLFVEPEFRGKGIGSKLLRRVCAIQ